MRTQYSTFPNFQYVNLFGFEQEGTLIGFMGIAEGNLEMLFNVAKLGINIH